MTVIFPRRTLITQLTYFLTASRFPLYWEFTTYVVSACGIPQLRIFSSDPIYEPEDANSYVRYWVRLRLAELPLSLTHAQRFFWNSEPKCPWRSWGTWACAWGEDHDGFKVYWGIWIYWIWHQSFRGHWFESIDQERKVRLLVCCEDMLKEKERSSSRQASLFDLFKLF
jgi:hypothetical protein